MKKVPALLLFILSLGLLTMCGGSGGDSGTGLQTVTGSSETGTGGTSTGEDAAGTSVLRVLLTDKPAEELLQVNVTIASVRVHQSSEVGEADGGWIELPVSVNAPMPVDLLTLRNGVLLQLCEKTLPTGNYQQVRLVLTPNTGTEEPFNQSVTTADGAVHALDVPSDTIKILHSLSLGAGQTTDLTLDFDAAESVRQRGNGSWFMQPVIKPASSTAG